MGNTGLLTGTAGTLTLFETGTYTITATAIDDAGNPHTAFATVTVTNTAPSVDSFTADATRNVVNDRYYADLKAACSDPDGDAVHLEWDEEYQEDGYYTIGTHTIRVRAVESGAPLLIGYPEPSSSTMTRLPSPPSPRRQPVSYRMVNLSVMSPQLQWIQMVIP